MTAELASTKKAADKVSAELESTKGKLDKATTKGKELGDEVKEQKVQLSQSQKDHDAAVKVSEESQKRLEQEVSRWEDLQKKLQLAEAAAASAADAAVKAGSALSQQLECVKGEHAAKVQEYECTMKAASVEFASKEKQMTAESVAPKSGRLVVDIGRIWIYLRVSTVGQKRHDKTKKKKRPDKDDCSIAKQVGSMSVLCMSFTT
jgi:hypothetical protein